MRWRYITAVTAGRREVTTAFAPSPAISRAHARARTRSPPRPRAARRQPASGETADSPAWGEPGSRLGFASGEPDREGGKRNRTSGLVSREPGPGCIRATNHALRVCFTRRAVRSSWVKQPDRVAPCGLYAASRLEEMISALL
jgi:hypothetical protein